MRIRTYAILGCTAALTLGLAACGGSEESEASANWREATSVEDGGGMEQLIEDAQAEGSLNTMGLFDDWANYGGLLAAFSEKYDIEVNNDTSTSSSQDQVNAIINREGQNDSLDYLDTGMSFAADAAADGLLAEYTPETIDDVDEDFRSPDGTWSAHLGGTMAIGCDTSRVEVCPTSFAELLDEQYANQVALPSDPTHSEGSFMAVHAAAVANGGGLDDIAPGVDFFRELSDLGVFVPAEANAGTIETGETPIVINWDYLLQPIADDLEADSGTVLEINFPEDGQVASFYTAMINADAPNPAAARLFIEFLFSDEGQNLLLEGFVTPSRIDAMIDADTVDSEALSRLPNQDGITAPMPSLEEREANQQVVNDTWAEAIQ